MNDVTQILAWAIEHGDPPRASEELLPLGSTVSSEGSPPTVATPDHGRFARGRIPESREMQWTSPCHEASMT